MSCEIVLSPSARVDGKQKGCTHYKLHCYTRNLAEPAEGHGHAAGSYLNEKDFRPYATTSCLHATPPPTPCFVVI